jgi:hypothetical protein
VSRRLGLFALLASLAVGGRLEAADLVFSPVAPCRLIDTRQAVGKFAPGETRSYVLRGPTRNYAIFGGNPAGCGIPDLSPGSVRRNVAQALVVNVVAANPDGPGNLRAWPANRAMPASSVINYVGLGAFGVSSNNVANEIILQTCDEEGVSPCTEGDVSLRADVSGVHVIVDVVGYMRAPDLAGLLSRGLIYESTASGTVPGAQNATVVAACDDATDFPLSGSCSSNANTGSVVIVGSRSLNWSSTATPAQFECTFFNQIASAATGTARLMCIALP